MTFINVPVIERVAVIYGIILAGLRLTGKREIGQMAPFDFVLLLLIANAVQNAMVGPDTSLVGGITAALTLFLINASIARLTLRYPYLRKIVEGTPTILVRDGSVIYQNLLKEGISRDMLAEMLREHGTSAVSDVRLAMLEIDGSISVVRTDNSKHIFRQRHRFRVFQKK